MFRLLRVWTSFAANLRAAIGASRWNHFAIWAVLATLVSGSLHGAGWRWSTFLDNAALDAFFALRGAHAPADVAEKLPQSRDIVIVELRNDTPRGVLALLLPKLQKARAVGLDLMFDDHQKRLPTDAKPFFRSEMARWKAEDLKLARAIASAGNVVLGAWNEQIPTVNSDRPTQGHWNWPPTSLRTRARTLAHLGVVPDVQDGIIRHVHLFQNIENRRVPALGLALAAMGRGLKPQKMAESQPAHAGAMPINYLGPRALWEYDTNRIVFERALEAEPEDFSGKIVLVGQTDYRSKDIFPTPFGDMPGLFLHANVVATLLDSQHAPRPLAPLWVGLLSLLFSLVLVATLFRFPVWMCAPVALLEMMVVALVGAWFFARWSLILSLSVPFGALFLTYNGIALYEYRRARSTLGRVVGPNTAAQLLDDRQNPHLGGKLQNATAFFCDLRGYSTFSERLSPEELIALLNLYTAAVVREVQARGGRPIDYFGDGVFVLFEPGAADSAEGQNHAMRAVRAAQATQIAIAEQMQALQSAVDLDPALHAAAATPLVAGIALHSGPMVIGLVGADNHIKPGAVGDAVNVAARLQGLSDECGFPILLSRATLEACQAPIEATFCGQFPIKGRQGLLDVFGIDKI